MPPGDSRPDCGVSTRVNIIVAVSDNGVIGRGGGLPWRLPDDLRRFKALTIGHPVIMGRRTWESLGRPLPGRRNIVVTRNRAYAAQGVEIAGSLQKALAQVADAAEVFVIGGASLYADALPLAHRLYLTRVHAEVEGDVRFPAWSPDDWQEVEADAHPADAQHPFAFTALVFESRRNRLEKRI